MAINSTDLRIGNILDVLNESGVISQDTGYNWMVVEILENGVNVRPFSEPTDPKEFYTFDRLSPITLTEEWLVRLGFEYTKQTVGGFERWLHTESGIKLLDKKLNYGVDKQSRHIIYLHELQNLFKALTNKELLLNR